MSAVRGLLGLVRGFAGDRPWFTLAVWILAGLVIPWEGAAVVTFGLPALLLAAVLLGDRHAAEGRVGGAGAAETRHVSSSRGGL